MNPYALPPFITTVLVALMGFIVYSRNKASELNRAFSLFCASMTVWLFGFTVMYASHDRVAALWWARLGFAGVSFIPPTMLHFVLIFLHMQRPKLIKSLYFVSLFGLAVGWTNLVYKGIWVDFWGYYPIAGPLYPIFPLTFSICFMGGVVLSYLSLHKEVEQVRRQQIKWVMLAFACGTPGLIDYIVKYQVHIYPFGYLAALMLISLIAYAILKHHLMDIELLARDTLTQILAWGLLSFPFVIGLILGHLLSSRPGFLYHRGPGDLFCVALNYSLALALLRNYKDPLCDRLRWVFALLGTWELSILVLTVPPQPWSHFVYRCGYAVGAFMLLALFSFWERFFENAKDRFSMTLRYGLEWTVLVMAVLSVFTPWIIRGLQFEPDVRLLAKEMPGVLYGAYGIWFVAFLVLMGLWSIRAIRRLPEETPRRLKMWIVASLTTATGAATTYFLFTIGKISWVYYTPLEAIMCFSLTGALSHRMHRTAQPMDFRFGAITLVTPFATGIMLMFAPIWRGFALLLAAVSAQRIVNEIEKSVQAWVDQTPFFRRKFGHLLASEKKAKEIKLLDSLEEALPIATEKVLDAFPFCKSCAIIVRFTDQDYKPGDRSVKIRTADGRVVEAARWADETELALLDVVRAKGELLLRDSGADWPAPVQALDEWFLEVAMPLKARGEIVGVITLGPKEDGALFHEKDVEILKTMAETLSDQMSSNFTVNQFRYLVNNTLHDALNYIRRTLGKLEMGLPLDEVDAANLQKHNTEHVCA